MYNRQQVASIGESSLSRTQFSFAKEGGVCLRTSAPSLCPSQTLPESQSPLVLYAMALGFLATYFPLILFWALTCSPVCCLPYGSSQDFPPWSLTFSPEPTGKPHLPLVVWGISSHLLVTSDSKFKVEWTVWLQNSGSLSSSLSVGWPALSSLSSTHCHKPLMWISFDWQDSIFLLPYCQSCIAEFLQPENCIPSPLPIFKGISRRPKLTLTDYKYVRHQNT